MKNRILFAGFLALIIIASSSTAALTVSLASGSNGKDKIFKNWQSLIQPIFDLQNRVSQLEQDNAALQNRVNELENKVDSLTPPPPTSDYLQFSVDGDPITHTYGSGDTVAFHGRVSPIIEGNAALIKVYDPSDSQMAASVDTPDAQGNFYGDAFDIPSGGGEDGVWTAKATYNGINSYTYFIVDDETDEIALDLNNNDHGQYEAGDTVTITGQVDQRVNGESDVIITIMDPNSDLVVDQEQSELGAGTLSDDEFRFSFTLDSNASLGRYAVIVSYDNDNQMGTALFEIPFLPTVSGDFSGDSDVDGSLAAQIQKDSYIAGDGVKIQGTIDNYDSADNEDLAVTVRDPDGVKVSDYGDSSAAVKSDGDFDYAFELSEDAQPGTYTVTIVYSADQVRLTFDVANSG